MHYSSNKSTALFAKVIDSRFGYINNWVFIEAFNNYRKDRFNLYEYELNQLKQQLLFE